MRSLILSSSEVASIPEAILDMATTLSSHWSTAARYFRPLHEPLFGDHEALKSVYPGLEVRDAESLERHALSLMSQPEAVAAPQKCGEAIVAKHRGAPFRNTQLVRDVVHFGEP